VNVAQPPDPLYHRPFPTRRSSDLWMKEASRSHLVLIPSYNPGERVYETVQAARRSWNPVWVVVDASTDGTGEELSKRAKADPGRSEEHTSELQSLRHLVCRLQLE